MDLNLATNDELKQMCVDIEKQYNVTKTEIEQLYAKLVKYSEEYETIKTIINKREGK